MFLHLAVRFGMFVEASAQLKLLHQLAEEAVDGLRAWVEHQFGRG